MISKKITCAAYYIGGSGRGAYKETEFSGTIMDKIRMFRQNDHGLGQEDFYLVSKDDGKLVLVNPMHLLKFVSP